MTQIDAKDLIMPMFVVDGKHQRQPITSMPGIERVSIDELLKDVSVVDRLQIPSIALFPNLDDSLKDPMATESRNAQGLFQRSIRAVKKEFPHIQVITDVAMDPYSSEGHDGFVEDDEIINSKTLPILVEMALSQAQAGADVIAPSDMMDGRVRAIREVLNKNGFAQVKILSYSAKYASAFYGPFRDALDSAPKSGDKKTYQMDPANRREAVREVLQDIKEGADMVMVKPAFSYLDIIAEVKEHITCPLAAYNVSGEYAMVKAVELKNSELAKQLRNQMLSSIKRAGADVILTYFAREYMEDQICG